MSRIEAHHVERVHWMFDYEYDREVADWSYGAQRMNAHVADWSHGPKGTRSNHRTHCRI